MRFRRHPTIDALAEFAGGDFHIVNRAINAIKSRNNNGEISLNDLVSEIDNLLKDKNIISKKETLYKRLGIKMTNAA